MPDVQRYIDERLKDQISYFANAAAREQGRGRRLQNVQIAAAAATPFLIGLAEMLPETPGEVVRALSLLAAFAAAIATGILAVRQHWQQGVLYRAREQALIRELTLWEQQAGPYAPAQLAEAGTEADRLLVENVEGIIRDDVADWTARMKNATARMPEA